jgi:hypothetical protein
VSKCDCQRAITPEIVSVCFPQKCGTSHRTTTIHGNAPLPFFGCRFGGMSHPRSSLSAFIYFHFFSLASFLYSYSLSILILSISTMVIDPALIALPNECTVTPGTVADPHTLPTTTAVRPPNLVLEPSSGPTRSTSARACEWTCDSDAFGLTTCFLNSHSFSHDNCILPTSEIK